MTQAAAYQRTRPNPTALTIVILLHTAAIGALAMSKIEVPRSTATDGRAGRADDAVGTFCRTKPIWNKGLRLRSRSGCSFSTSISKGRS